MLLLIVAAAVVVAVVAYLVSSYSDGGNSKDGRPMPARRRLRKLRRAVPLQALKTIVVSWQILTQVGGPAFNFFYCIFLGETSTNRWCSSPTMVREELRYSLMLP